MLLGIRQSSFEPLSGPRSPLAAAQTDEHHSSSSGNPSSSRRQQMLAALNHRQQQPSSTGRASGSRGGGKRGRDGGACPPSRLERTREERGAAQKQQQQQQREGGGRELGNAGTRSDNGVSAATPLAASSSTAGIVMENGRDTRRASEGGGRRHPTQRQHSQRRWTKGAGGTSSGSGPNSPRPIPTGPGTRPGRRRRPKPERQVTSEVSDRQTGQQLDLVLTTNEDHTQRSKGEVGSGEGVSRRKRSSANNRRGRGTRPMSSIDSGKGDDLSSSCESSVFDPQTPSILVESMGVRSRCSSCTSSIEEEFHDALSHPPSDDDDGVNSSAFVTPSTSTPPQSPRPRPSNENTAAHADLSSESSRQQLRQSLEKINGCLQESHDHPTGSCDHPTESCDHPMESCDGHMTEEALPGEQQSRVVKSESDLSSTNAERVGESQVPSGNGDAGEQGEVSEEVGGDGGPGEGVRVGGGEGEREGDLGERKESEFESSSLHVDKQHGTSGPTHTCSPLDPLEMMSSESVTTSSVDRPSRGSCSGSDASPQSSVCSNSSHPQTPPLLSSPSHSPSPSTPSRHSPSPSTHHHHHVATDTVATDTITAEMGEGTQEWPILCPVVGESEKREDEWPDLHSPTTEVKGQPVEPFTNAPPTGEEVRVQPLDNAAAAYPHVIQSPSPYPIAWAPHFFHPLQHIPTTTGPYSYYQFHPAQTGFTSYYPPHAGPGFMWHGPHISLPPHSVPVPYAYSDTRDDVACGIASETPPISPREAAYPSNEETETEVCEERVCEDCEDGDICEGGEGVEEGDVEEGLSEVGAECEGVSEVGAECEGVEEGLSEVDAECGGVEEGLSEVGAECEGVKEGDVEEGLSEVDAECEGVEKGDVEEVGAECEGVEEGDVEEGVSEVDAECEGVEEEVDAECEGVKEVETTAGEDEGREVTSEESVYDTVIAPVPSSYHPLESTWVMWYDRLTGNTRNNRSDYRSSLKNLYTMSCVEDFWRLYNNIRHPSNLDRNSNYHFFKEGVEPLWEDPANEQGGKWVITLRDETILNRVWEELLLAMIGGVIESGHSVNGAVVSRRKKGDRVALWTSKKSAKINLNICVDLLRVLVIACEVSTEKLPDFIQQLAGGQGRLSLEYMYHRDSLRSGTSYQNSGHINLGDNCQSLVAKVLEKLT